MKREHYNLARKVHAADTVEDIAAASAAFGKTMGHPAPVTTETDKSTSHGPVFSDSELRTRRPDLYD